MTITTWQDLNTLEQALDHFLDTTSPRKYPCYEDAKRLLKTVRQELLKTEP